MTLLVLLYAAAICWLFHKAVQAEDGADQRRNDRTLLSLEEYRARANRRSDA